MRLKRSKQYRKLMQQYAITFGFREPYQVLGNPRAPGNAFERITDRLSLQWTRR